MQLNEQTNKQSASNRDGISSGTDILVSSLKIMQIIYIQKPVFCPTTETFVFCS